MLLYNNPYDRMKVTNCSYVITHYFLIVFSSVSFRLRDTHGWEHVFTSPYFDSLIEKIALNTKMPGPLGDKMVAAASGSYTNNKQSALIHAFYCN